MSTENSNRKPDQIPSVPSVDLSYDTIEKMSVIGEGGNADVYNARVTSSTDTLNVALKQPRMNGTLHTDTIERMMEEAETWQQLDDHDYIVSIVDYESEPMPWIAMEYMDGGHLGVRKGEINFEQKLWTAVVISEAVQYAHRHGVAHLDLKPENILFRESDKTWDIPKVADWGLSKHLLKHSQSIEGLSPHYAAPEQFDNNLGSTDNFTDIYQLGAIFYELFTGQQPFSGQPATVMNKVLNEQPNRASEVADVPPEIDDILQPALKKQKQNRYDSVLYLRDEFKSLLRSNSNSKRTTSDSLQTRKSNTGHGSKLHEQQSEVDQTAPQHIQQENTSTEESSRSAKTSQYEDSIASDNPPTESVQPPDDETKIRIVNREKEMDRTVDDFITMGYKIKTKGDRNITMKKKDFGSIFMHSLIFILSVWWTLGIGNGIYAAYRYIWADEVVIRIDESESPASSEIPELESARIRRVGDKETRNQLIDDFTTRDYVVKSEGERMTILKQKDYGSRSMHRIIFILSVWWTFGISNALYASYKYSTSEKVQIVSIDS